MSESREPLPDNCLVVVADGTGARFFRVNRDGENPSLKECDSLSPSALADEGPSGARPPEQTPRQTNEATFAKQLSERLYQLAHAGNYDDLVLIADPQTLGQVRGSMHQEVSSRMRREIARTLTNSPVSDIEPQVL